MRLFPQGTHGITIGEKTGSPLEIVRERRFVADYYPTMLAWIHHAGGPEFAAARQVDVEDGEIPLESRGMHEVSWFGSGEVQPWLLAGALVVFTSAILILPLGYLLRTSQDHRCAPTDNASSTPSNSTLGAIESGESVSLVYVLRQLVEADPSPLFAWLPTVWNSLVIATWLSLVLTVYLLAHVCGRLAQRLLVLGQKNLSRAGGRRGRRLGLVCLLLGPDTPRLVGPQLGEGNSPILLRGLRRIGNMPAALKPAFGACYLLADLSASARSTWPVLGSIVQVQVLVVLGVEHEAVHHFLERLLAFFDRPSSDRDCRD